MKIFHLATRCRDKFSVAVVGLSEIGFFKEVRFLNETQLRFWKNNCIIRLSSEHPCLYAIRRGNRHVPAWPTDDLGRPVDALILTDRRIITELW